MPDTFKITDTVSTTDWGNVDKSKIWQALKTGIEEGAGGVADAVKEVYAVVKATVNEDLTQADCWGPHHEIRRDGSVVLNKAGLIAAAAALAGARSEPDLTAEQKAQARRHLRRHYQEIEEEPPESLSEGELISLEARIAGEMRPQDIPIAPDVDLEALKAGDDDPMEVVVEVPAGKSKRDWNYTGEALKDIVTHVNSNTLNGFLGHQKPEEVESQFPTPVTHWIGGLWRDGKAYFRGVIDKAAADLKRWIRARRVKQVSIYGLPELQRSNGEVHVVGYKPLSIDWTPLDRAGMPTRIVAVGEMHSTFGTDGKKKADDHQGGDADMTMKEMLAEIRAAIAKGEMKFPEILGEMGITKDQAVEALVGEQLKKHKAGAEFGVKLASALGLDRGTEAKKALEIAGEMAAVWKKLGFDKDKPEKPVEAVGEMIKTYDEAAKAKQDKLIDDCIKEKVSGEQAGKLIRRLLDVPEDANKEKITGEIDVLLADEEIKALLGKDYIDPPAPKGGGSNKGPRHLQTKNVPV